MRHLFLADGYGRSFRRKQVLKSASVWVGEGTVTALFGRNGSGKSTLLECALGLRRADYGATHYAGRAWSPARLGTLARHGLFYLPDREFLPRRPRMRTLMEAVERVHGSAEQRPGVLERLGVTGLEHRRAGQLSGGERRRFEWALALLSRPRCVIADEPLAGITPRDQEVVATMLRQLADGGAGILVTGHDVPELFALVDNVIWMTAGTTHGLGSPEEARSHHLFRRDYLGTHEAGDRPATAGERSE
jgi:ABC-type multidrug transport system ATPase subunit